ncbi:ankyrin repeat-containing domain protein, partial [Blyttiomyces helicus]
VDARDDMGRTPLHWAAVAGHAGLVVSLLNSGAKDTCRDGAGATPLHYACSKNHARCAAALVEGG